MAEGSETTPLLTDPSAGPSRGNEQTDANTTAELPAPYLRATFILTWLSMVLSVLTFGLITTVAVIDQHSPRGYDMNWQLKDSCRVMIGTGAFVAFISFLNLLRLYRCRRAMWLLVNLIADAIVFFYSFSFCINGLSTIFESYGPDCSSRPWDPNPPDYDRPTCEAFSKKIRILAGIGLGFGLAMAIVHMILFLIRCVLAYRWIFLRGPNKTWRFPTGQLTVEFTIKILRQEEAIGSRSGEEQ